MSQKVVRSSGLCRLAGLAGRTRGRTEPARSPCPQPKTLEVHVHNWWEWRVYGLKTYKNGRIPMGGWGRHWIRSLGLLRISCKDELGRAMGRNTWGRAY